MAVCVATEEGDGFLGVDVEAQLTVFGDVAGDARPSECDNGNGFPGGLGVGREVERGLVQFVNELGVQVLLLVRWMVPGVA
ncbi:hypothetical protein OG923_34340 (plasmid) [Streptomyces halstedii]|uniref:hypothetical protein n=1 Tax=Streptomyces halstedii TaxID=1944 RepID=UPI00324C0767